MTAAEPAETAGQGAAGPEDPGLAQVHKPIAAGLMAVRSIEEPLFRAETRMDMESCRVFIRIEQGQDFFDGLYATTRDTLKIIREDARENHFHGTAEQLSVVIRSLS